MRSIGRVTGRSVVRSGQADTEAIAQCVTTCQSPFTTFSSTPVSGV